MERAPAIRYDLKLVYAASMLVATVMTIVSLAGLLDWRGAYPGIEAKMLPLFVAQDALNVVVGFAIACVSQTTTFGWTHPVMIIGSALGLVGLAAIAAGIFGWDGIVRPIASLAPGGTLVAATTEQLALVAIAAVIATNSSSTSHSHSRARSARVAPRSCKAC